MSPDGLSSAREQRRRRRVGLAGLFAVLVVMVGATVVLGSLTTPPEPEEATGATAAAPTEVEAPTTTLPFSVSQIERGEPIQFEQVLQGEGWPVAIVEQDGAVFVFASRDLDVHGGLVGMSGWVSANGSDWAPLPGEITSDYSVSSVIATEHGLLAWGLTEEGQRPVVWMSPDGGVWEQKELPLPPEIPADHGTHLYPAASAGEVIMIFGSAGPIGGAGVEEAIAAAMGVDTLGYGWSHQGTGQPVAVHGPAGVTLAVFTLEELGLDPEQVETIYSSGGPGMTVWSSTDGATWVPTTQESYFHVQNIFTGPDGRTYVSEWGPFIWSTDDGVEFVRHELGVVLDVLVEQGGQYFGYRGHSNRPEILVSDNLIDWEPIELFEDSPNHIEWQMWPAAAGGAGLAMNLQGHSNRGPHPQAVVTPVEITRDDHTLVISDTGTLIIRDQFETVLLVPRWSDTVFEFVRPDIQARTITFVHPKTGADLMTVTFHELDEAEQQVFTEADHHGTTYQALVYSGDGIDWTVQSLDWLVDGHNTWLADIEVGETGVYLVAVRDVYSPNPELRDQSFVIWHGSAAG